MRGVEHTVSLFFNDVSKISITNQMIIYQKEIYKLFGPGIFHKPCSIFKSESYEFKNINIGLFSFSDTSMDGYFIGRHRDMRIIEALLATFYSE